MTKRGVHASRVGATISVLVSLAVVAGMPNRYLLGPRWIAPTAGIVLIVLLALSAVTTAKTTPGRLHGAAMIGAVCVVMLLNVLSLAQLIDLMVFDPTHIEARRLLGSSIVIWIGNVLTFALLYWLLDGGGPDSRIASDEWRADFLFPQPVRKPDIDPGWRPNFMDYVFLAFTTATAFSPTDTAPLTTRARTLMMVESVASLMTIAIAAARAINILS